MLGESDQLAILVTSDCSVLYVSVVTSATNFISSAKAPLRKVSNRNSRQLEWYKAQAQG